MNKTTLNYWTDLVIALAFLMSTVSGIVFLAPVTSTTVFGVPYRAWSQVHTWGSLAMLAGVLAHLVLHWKWIAVMTRKIFFLPSRTDNATFLPRGYDGSRRSLLLNAGVTAGAMLALGGSFRWWLASMQTSAAGGMTASEGQLLSLDTVPFHDLSANSQSEVRTKLLIDENTADGGLMAGHTVADEPLLPTVTSTPMAKTTSTPVPAIVKQNGPASGTAAVGTVLCPKRLLYDPYPGKCRHYVDRDGDGYCDLSVPT